MPEAYEGEFVVLGDMKKGDCFTIHYGSNPSIEPMKWPELNHGHISFDVTKGEILKVYQDESSLDYRFAR